MSEGIEEDERSAGSLFGASFFFFSFFLIFRADRLCSLSAELAPKLHIKQQVLLSSQSIHQFRPIFFGVDYIIGSFWLSSYSLASDPTGEIWFRVAEADSLQNKLCILGARSFVCPPPLLSAPARHTHETHFHTQKNVM